MNSNNLWNDVNEIVFSDLTPHSQYFRAKPPFTSLAGRFSVVSSQPDRQGVAIFFQGTVVQGDFGQSKLLPVKSLLKLLFFGFQLDYNIDWFRQALQFLTCNKSLLGQRSPWKSVATQTDGLYFHYMLSLRREQYSSMKLLLPSSKCSHSTCSGEFNLCHLLCLSDLHLVTTKLKFGIRRCPKMSKYSITFDYNAG